MINNDTATDEPKTDLENPHLSSESKEMGAPISLAIVALIALILALSSLTIISSRQFKLNGYESDMLTLQERITASVFLSLESENLSYLSESSEVVKSETIDPQKIRGTYAQLSNNLSQIKDEISNGYIDEPRSPTQEYLRFLSMSVFSNDALLGMLLVSCGIIGSVVSTLRDGKYRASKAVILGGSVGFIALLGVKSGSDVFLMTNLGVNVPFNPYSTALAGVVSGMFSEKLYKALSGLTDRATKRIQSEQASVGNADKPRA